MIRKRRLALLISIAVVAAAAIALGAAGAPNGFPNVRSAESVPAGTVERSCLYGNAAEARGFQHHDRAVF